MPALSLPPSLSPLRHRDFAIYWVGQLFANIGRQFETTATAWLLYELSESPLIFAAAGIGRGGAVILLTLLGGSVIDRVGSRVVLYWAQSIYAVVSLLLAFLVYTRLIQPWHLVSLGILNGVVLAFDAPARQSMYAWLVPREELARAVPLNNSLRQLGLVAGPSLAGLLIYAFGTLPIYLANGVAFGGLIVSLRLIRSREALGERKGSLWQQTLQGLTFVAHSRVLSGLLLLLGLFSLFSHSTALMTIFARDVLQEGARGLGILGGATGAGAVLGSILTVSLSAYVKRQGLLLLVAGLVYGVALALFGLSAWLPLSLVLGVGLGLWQAVWSAMANTLVQLASPDAMRGRVISFHVLVTRGFDGFSQAQVGLLVSLMGPVPAVITAAALLCGSVLAVAASMPAIRGFRAPVGATAGHRAPARASQR